MDSGSFKTRYNVMRLSSLDAFAKIRGGMNKNCRDVYFIRVIGGDRATAGELERMDAFLTGRKEDGQFRYHRINQLPKMNSVEDAQRCNQYYEQWIDSGMKELGPDDALKNVLSEACNTVLECFRGVTANSNASIEKNFIVKLLYWLEQVKTEVIGVWNPRTSMKFVIANISKKQEYLFCYLLTLLGVDVLILQAQEDIDAEVEALGLSENLVLGKPGGYEIPAYKPEQYQNKKREKKEAEEAVVNTHTGTKTEVQPQREQRELEFEELALLASSVVMIAIHDKKGEVLGTGSGIMIGRDGYILTNNHVASGGRYYSVRIEDEEKIYETDEIIKYNPVLDLALIRIDRRLQPIPVYRGGRNLVRGQKVVAIGSPLGLFNSVSDGIISGFRRIDDVDMIQFTAPISHGSSGGAVLNIQGEVIGISTAGIDSGQNINLAVGYENIQNFIKGFV